MTDRATEAADTIKRMARDMREIADSNGFHPDHSLYRDAAALDALVAERDRLRLGQWAYDALRAERKSLRVRVQQLEEAVLTALTGCEGEITGARLQALNDAYEDSQ